MDLVNVVQTYILKILEEAGPGMKVMLLDAETTPIVSLAFAQSALMRQEIYLFERLQSSPVKEDLRHLKCIVIVRPEDSINNVCAEIANPRYGSYYLNFTNIIPKSAVKQIAEADMKEVVKDIREIYTDYLPVGAHMFGLNIPNPLQPLGSRWVEKSLQRCSHAISSLLLALKMSPVIRYQEGSGPASILAQSVRQVIAREGGLFDAGATDNSPVLLILDRREDPVTPLLSQWTYQAMVHQLIGINNNRVNLAGLPGLTKDLQDIVLSSHQDEFYAANLYSNFGEIGQTIKVLMEDFQNKAKSHQKIESISDMKNFVENYPQFKKMSGTVSKHVTLVSELSRLVSTRKLLEISEVEQELVSGADQSTMLKQVSELVKRDDITLEDATRLVMLYTLRFESANNNGVRNLLSLLRKRGGETEARQVQNLQRFAGVNARNGDLFGDQANATKNMAGKLMKGLKGVENVYTQHQPCLRQTLDELFKGRLKSSLFPCLGSNYEGKVVNVVVFVIGGFTYEEAYSIYQLNSTLKVQVLLGGTSILNSRAFLDQIEHAFPPQSTAVAPN